MRTINGNGHHWFELTVSEKSRNVLKTIKLSSRRLRWLRAHCLQQFAGYVQKRRRSRHTSTNPLQENGTLSLDVSKVRGVYLSAERERGWMAEGKRAAWADELISSFTSLQGPISRCTYALPVHIYLHRVTSVHPHLP